MADPDPTGPYAARLDIDYPDRDLDRLSSFLRPLFALPAMLILAMLTGASGTARGTAPALTVDWHGGITVAGALFAPTLLALLFRQRYPRWWFDWHLGYTRFASRVGAYMLLLRDEMPALEDEQAVHVRLDYPDAARDLSRWMPLVKWLLAIPHYLLLAVLFSAVVLCTIFAWIAILFTGRYPSSLFGFVVGVLRWSLRVQAYAFLLITDRYPPFSLSE